jgi:hypothetical protein
VKSMALIPTVVIGGAGAGIGVATSATAQAAPLQSQPPGTRRRPATGSRSSSTIVSGRLSTPPSRA